MKNTTNIWKSTITLPEGLAHDLIKIARAEDRSTVGQIRHFIKQGIKGMAEILAPDAYDHLSAPHSKGKDSDEIAEFPPFSSLMDISTPAAYVIIRFLTRVQSIRLTNDDKSKLEKGTFEKEVSHFIELFNTHRENITFGYYHRGASRRMSMCSSCRAISRKSLSKRNTKARNYIRQGRFFYID